MEGLREVERASRLCFLCVMVETSKKCLKTRHVCILCETGNRFGKPKSDRPVRPFKIFIVDHFVSIPVSRFQFWNVLVFDFFSIL